MPTANSSNNAVSWPLLGAGIVACLFLHLAALSGRPGLHYDEAWAMNYSWRIAAEPGFWPWQAMSPYTAPLAHYWAALWLKAFGPSLFVFRLSQVVLSLGAIFLLSAELLRAGFARAASLFPLAAALIPGLVLNHRFAIELNGVHPFFFALLLAALLRGKPGLAVIAWVLATAAHILFYGVGLGLVAAALWEGRRFSRAEKRAITLGAFALALFFLHVLFKIPEKGKAGALLLSALALPLSIQPWFRLPAWRPRWLLWALASVFLFNLFFFAEGQWGAAITTGLERKSRLFLELLLFLGMAGTYGFIGLRRLPKLFSSWFLCSLLILGVMMLKPAPRYYELPLLVLALFLAFGLAERKRIGISLAYFVAHTALVGVGFFLEPPRERALHFLFFKDSSRDFLAKQELARFLGRNGCKVGDIKSVDSRVGEALKALALSSADWPMEGSRCRWPALSIRHGAELGSEREFQELVADFVVEGSDGH